MGCPVKGAGDNVILTQVSGDGSTQVHGTAKVNEAGVNEASGGLGG
jgi:hypothetical protein